MFEILTDHRKDADPQEKRINATCRDYIRLPRDSFWHFVCIHRRKSGMSVPVGRKRFCDTLVTPGRGACLRVLVAEKPWMLHFLGITTPLASALPAFTGMTTETERQAGCKKKRTLDRDMDLFRELREIRILLIDDDKWIRDSLVMYFEGEGCCLSVCETAEEGLEALHAQSFQAVIVDYLLPGIDGLEFFRRIRESHPSLLKILITAYGNQGVFAEAELVGVESVIEKPFTVEILKQSLSRLLEAKSREVRFRQTAEKDDDQGDY